MGSHSIKNVVQTLSYNTETSFAWDRTREQKQNSEALRRKAEELRRNNVRVPDIREAARIDTVSGAPAAGAESSIGSLAEQGTRATTSGSDAQLPAPTPGPRAQGNSTATKGPQSSRPSTPPREHGAAPAHVSAQAHHRNAPVRTGPRPVLHVPSAPPPSASTVRAASSSFGSEAWSDPGRYVEGSHAPAPLGAQSRAAEPVPRHLLLQMCPDLQEHLSQSTPAATSSSLGGVDFADQIFNICHMTRRDGQNGARPGGDSFFPASSSGSQSTMPMLASSGSNGTNGSHRTIGQRDGHSDGAAISNGSHVTFGQRDGRSDGAPFSNGRHVTSGQRDGLPSGAPISNGSLKATGQRNGHSNGASISNGARAANGSPLGTPGGSKPSSSEGGRASGVELSSGDVVANAPPDSLGLGHTNGGGSSSSVLASSMNGSGRAPPLGSRNGALSHSPSTGSSKGGVAVSSADWSSAHGSGPSGPSLVSGSGSNSEGAPPLSDTSACGDDVPAAANGGGIMGGARTETGGELMQTDHGHRETGQREVPTSDGVAAWAGEAGREPSHASGGIPGELVPLGGSLEEGSGVSLTSVDEAQGLRATAVSPLSEGAVLQMELGGTEASHINGACPAEGAQSHRVPRQAASLGGPAGPEGADGASRMQAQAKQDQAPDGNGSLRSNLSNTFDWTARTIPREDASVAASGTAAPKDPAAVPGDQQTVVMAEEGSVGNGIAPQDSPVLVPGDQRPTQGAKDLPQRVVDGTVGLEGSRALPQVGDIVGVGPAEAITEALESRSAMIAEAELAPPEQTVNTDAACTTSRDTHGPHSPSGTSPDPVSPAESALLEHAPGAVGTPGLVPQGPDQGNLEEALNRGQSGTVRYAQRSRTEDGDGELPLLYRNARSGTARYAPCSRTEGGGTGVPLPWGRDAGHLGPSGPSPALHLQKVPEFDRDVMYLLLGRLLEEHRERRDAAAARLYAQGLEDGLPAERYGEGREDGPGLKRYDEGLEDASAVERYGEGLEDSTRAAVSGPPLDLSRDAEGSHPRASSPDDAGSPGAAGPFLPVGRDAISQLLLIGPAEQSPVPRNWPVAEAGSILQEPVDGMGAFELAGGALREPVPLVPAGTPAAVLEESLADTAVEHGPEACGEALAPPEVLQEVLGEEVGAKEVLVEEVQESSEAALGEDVAKEGEAEEVVETDWEVPNVVPPPGVWVVDSVAEAERIVQLLCGPLRTRTFACDTEVGPSCVGSTPVSWQYILVVVVRTRALPWHILPWACLDSRGRGIVHVEREV